MINSYISTKCLFCGSTAFKKFGLSSNGIQRYRCRCGRTFLSTTGTIFDERRISISEWLEYCLNLFRHVSIWNNKNTFTTSRYWLQKLFLTLEDSQKGAFCPEPCGWMRPMTRFAARTLSIMRTETSCGVCLAIKSAYR